MNDFILDTNGDLLIVNGDFVIGESDAQNQSLLLQLPKGAIKESPDCTVGAINYIESEDPAGLLLEIRTRFTADGMQIKELGFDESGKLKIDAEYK